MKNYWNTCKILKVISNPNCKGKEEWLEVKCERCPEPVQVFASGCAKCWSKKTGLFDFEVFKPGKLIKLLIEGHLIENQKETIKDKKRKIISGKVIDSENNERVVEGDGLYIYFTDNKKKVQEGEKVSVIIYGVRDAEIYDKKKWKEEFGEGEKL